MDALVYIQTGIIGRTQENFMSSLRRVAIPSKGLVIATLLMVGCVPPAVSREDDGLEPGGSVITRADIERSGATDALQAIERAPGHLRIQRTRNDSPMRITHRGISSFLLSPDILVVIDGARVQTVTQHLAAIPAQSIAYIQILSGREASARFGSDATNGVIMVKTTALQ